MIKMFFIFVAIAVLAGCSSEERVIDNSDKKYKLIAVFEDSPGVSLVEMPSGTVLTKNILPDIPGLPPFEKVARVAEYRNVLYFIYPSAKKILALKKEDFSFLAIFD